MTFLSATSQRCNLPNRLSDQRGFSLVEMLAALVVLSLMTGMVAVGVSTATRAYGSELFASQADVLSGEIENALADAYRYTASDATELIVVDAAGAALGSDERGYFALTSGAAVTTLLNQGAYGNCTVQLVSFSCEKSEAEGKAVITTQGSYRIYSGDAATFKTYEFYFKSDGSSLNMGGLNGTVSSGGGGGGGNEGVAVDKSGLSDLIATAQAIERGNKTWASYNQLQSDIATAISWRDSEGATQDEVDAAKAALQEAILRFKSAQTEGGEDGDVAQPLRAKITDAETLLSSVSKPDAAKAALQSAIDAAKETVKRSDLTASSVSDAVTALNNAMETYRNASDGGSSGGGGGDAVATVRITVDGAVLSMPIVYCSSESWGFSDDDATTISNNGGLKEGCFYVVGSNVSYCDGNTSDWGTIRNNSGSVLVAINDLTFDTASGQARYYGTVTDADNVDGNGAFQTSRGSIVKQFGHYYLCVSYNGYYQNVACATDDRFIRLD